MLPECCVSSIDFDKRGIYKFIAPGRNLYFGDILTVQLSIQHNDDVSSSGMQNEPIAQTVIQCQCPAVQITVSRAHCQREGNSVHIAYR